MTMEKQKNYRMILLAEESFAQGVALGVWVQRPLTAWHYLLPGMFVWDILRRRMAVQQYSSLFLYPRKLALDAALGGTEGGDREREGVMSMAANRMQEWLTRKKVYSPRAMRGHMDQLAILLDHYIRLLQADGENYFALIRKTYGTRGNYEGYLAKLSAAEGEVDQGLAEIQGGTAESWERLRAEQVQVAQLRKKEMDRIFPEEG
jgi:hypothetical protein